MESMFISEIPVRYRAEKTLRWISDLNEQTTVDDILKSILPSDDLRRHSLAIVIGHQRRILIGSSRIYQVVAEFNQKSSARRLLFEIRRKATKKRVRFADEILIQNIQGRSLSNERTTCPMIETVSVPIQKRLEKLKENFQKHVQHQQEKYLSKRRTLTKISIQTATIKHLSRSSSESGISSSSSHEDLNETTKTLETLV